MRPGMWTTSAPGDVEDMVLDLGPPRVFESLGILNLRPTLAPRYGNRYWGFYIDGQKRLHKFIKEGEVADVQVPVVDMAQSIGVHMEDLGDWALEDYDPFYNAEAFEAITANRITFEWNANPTIESTGVASSQFTNWNFSLNALKRFSTVLLVAERPTWGVLNVTMIDVAGTRTVTVYRDRDIVAQGSLFGDGTLTLLEVNDSGFEGSTVDIVYLFDVTFGTFSITARWPATYQVHYSTAPLVFPRTPEATVLDDGSSNRFGFTTDVLVPGTYNLAVLAVSDSGKVDSATGAVSTKTIVARPSFPLMFVYDSGGLGFGAGNILLSPQILAPVPPPWSKIRITALDNDITGPDGLLSGTKLTESGIPGFTDHYVEQIISLTIGLTYQVFAIGKAGAFNTYARVEFGDGVGLPSLIFDLVAGVYTSLFGVPTADTIPPVNLGQGWWLFGFKRISLSTTVFGTYRYKIHNNSAGFNTFTNPFAYGYHFRSQIEVAATPTAPTVVRWIAPDPTSTFHVYDSIALDKVLDVTTPVRIEPAGAGEHFVMMPSMAGSTGKRRILCRTVSAGGIEEKNGNSITVEYGGGAHIELRPNSPRILKVTEVDIGGLKVIVTAAYDNIGARAMATHIKLYVQSSIFPIDYTSVQATGLLGLLVDGRGEVDIPFTVGAAGFYNIAVRATGIDGVVTDLNTIVKQIYLSNVDPSDVINFVTRVSRG